MSRFVPTWPPRKQVESEVLHDSRSSFVVRTGDAVRMNAGAKWSKASAAVARRFKINEIEVSAACAAGGLEFLEELPSIEALGVSVPDRTLDWKPVQRMARLRSLSLSSAPLVRTCPPGEIDLAALPNLIVCNLSKYDPQWSSVFRCTRLRSLHLTTTADLTNLDLGAMPRLTELALGGLPKLASFRLAERARVRSIQLRSCRRLSPDWPRVGRDLESLWIEGKTAWPLAALRSAPKLKRLMLSHRGRNESAEFLKGLPALRHLDLFLTEFDPAGDALVRSLKHLRAMMPRA